MGKTPGEIKRYYQYVLDVECGAVLVCDAMRKAVLRFKEDLEKSTMKKNKYRFDEEEADRIINFIEYLHHFEDPFAGQKIHLEPWECFFVGQLYGWRDKKTGYRRFKKAILFMGRKQGKTILASSLALFEILTKPGVEAYALATKQLISNKSFKNLQQFIAHNELLSKTLNVYKTPRSVEAIKTASIFMPLSSDSSLDGLNPSYAIIDELAAQDNGEAYSILTSGMGSRPERLTLIISTAAPSLDNPMIEEYNYAKRILKKELEDEEYMISIYEFDEGDRWDDLSCMQKSCPNLGVTVPLEYYAGELKKAKVLPLAALEYKTKYCNLWMVSNDTWIPDRLWGKAIRNWKKHGPTEESFESASAVLAVDFSTIWDYTALTKYIYMDDIGKYAALHKFYIPGDQVETKAHMENPTIRTWIEKGLIVATPGEAIDYSYLYRDIDAWIENGNVLAITYDPAKSKEFEYNYANRITIVPFPQKNQYMSPAAKAWEKAIVDDQICDANPVLRWMLSNTINKINLDSGSYYITKSDAAKSRKRIDGVITSIMAFSVLQAQRVELSKPKPKIFDLSKIEY